MEEITKLMDEEIKHQLRGMKSLESGSTEQTAAVKNLAALYEARINDERIRLDAEDKQEKREMERAQHAAEEALKKEQAAEDAKSKERDLQLREDQLKDQKTDRMMRVGIALVELGVPLVCYGHWFRKGLKFEETGSITSSMMRNLINKFKPKR